MAMLNQGNSNDSHYLVIDKKQTLWALKEEFNKWFPFLKIEFFHEKINKNVRNPKNLLIQTNELICHLQEKQLIGKIPFSLSTTVKEIEEAFLQEYGLYMQVFRKSGNIWLETTTTNDWTLAMQNEEGRCIAEYLSSEKDHENILDAL